MNFYTKVLTSGNSITLAATDGVIQLSIKVPTGSAATLQGNAAFRGSSTNDTQVLAAGDGFSCVAGNTQSPIVGLTIACTSGSINIIMGFN